MGYPQPWCDHHPDPATPDHLPVQNLAPNNLAAVDVMHVAPLLVAFALGLLARFAGLPPLIGLLAAGFLLGAMGMQNILLLQEIADLGVTLLLFTIGLKLRLEDSAARVVWLSACPGMR